MELLAGSRVSISHPRKNHPFSRLRGFLHRLFRANYQSWRDSPLSSSVLGLKPH